MDSLKHKRHRSLATPATFREDDDNADAATKEALRYSRALLEGFRSLQHRPLTTRTAEEICTQIKGMEMQVRRVPGTALARQPGEIVYTPPVGEDLLRSLLANWERFLHEANDIDPLIRMAVAHYQFEAIHPFTDGNGRTGRVLNSLYFISQAASRYLKGLVEIGVLTERAFGREKLFIHQRLMGLVIRDTNDWVPFP